MRRQCLDDGDSTATVQFHSDFYALAPGHAFFNCSTCHAAGYRTGPAANGCFGAFDLHRSQMYDFTVFNLLGCAGFGTAITLHQSGSTHIRQDRL